MRLDEKLTYYEGFSLFCMTFLYHVFNEVLPNLITTTGTSSWISQIVSIIMAFPYLGLFLLLMKRHPNQDFLQICHSVYGKYVAKAVLAVVLVFLFFYSAVSLNQSVELLQIYAYSEISALEIDFIMMTAICVFALYSIKGMGKTVSVFLPSIIGVVILILLISKQQYDPKLLTPIMGYGYNITFQSGLMLTSQFNGLLVLSIFSTSFGDRKTFRKSAVWGIMVASVLIVSTTICYNMAIPYTCAEDIMVGVLGIAQSNYTNRFIQRLESVFIAVTVMAIVLLLGVSFLAIKKIYCQLFGIAKRQGKAVIIPLAMIVICIARTMANRLMFKNLVRLMVRRYGIVLGVAVVLITLLVSWLRQAGGRWKAKLAATALIPCLLLGLFSGCTHYREPDAEIYPIIMGYDKGEQEQYRITMKFMLDAIPEASLQDEQEDSSGNSIPKDTVIMECPSFTEGINLINATIPKKISLLHLKMLVISEELARDGVADFVAPLIRYNEIKPTMAFVVSRNSAFDFITSEHATLTDSLQLDMELVLETNKESTSYFVISIAEFLYDYKSTYGDSIAMYGAVNQSKYDIPKEDGESTAHHIEDSPGSFEVGYLPGELPIAGNSKMELAGMAVFKEDKMVGELNTRETEIVMFLNGALNTGAFSLPDPYGPDEYYVSMQVRRVTAMTVKTRIEEDGKTYLDLFVPLNANVGVSQNPDVDYITKATERETLTHYLEQHLEERAGQLMEKLQKEYEADILQLGRYVAKHFLTIQEWEEYNWKGQFPDAEITINFSLNL